MSTYVCCVYNFIATTDVWQTVSQVLSKLQVQELVPAAVEVSSGTDMSELRHRRCWIRTEEQTKSLTSEKKKKNHKNCYSI